MITNVYMDHDLTQRVYTHKAVARFYNTEDYDKISISYSGTEPYGSDTKIRIYGLTPDQLVNSFSYDTSKLTDVTSKFTPEVTDGKITFRSTIGDVGFTTFYVELENGFGFDQNINSTITFAFDEYWNSVGTTTNIAKTKAPAGYELSRKATEIDVSKLDEGEALIQMDVYNDAKKDVPPGRGGNGSGAGPRTGDETHTGLYAGALVLSAVLVSLLVARKKVARRR